MTSAVLDLCVVVPAYQEEDRLPPLLCRLAAFCQSIPLRVEVIVVDDGSTDGTAEMAERFARDFDCFRVLRLPANRGKGAAVRTGMLASRARWRAFLDADGSVDPHELQHLLDARTPVAIASIAVPGARLEPAQPWYRVFLGKAGNRLIRLAVLPGIADSQRGCKLLRGDIAEAVFAECEVDRWGFDVEVLARARSLGHEPVEVGVRWTHRTGGTIGPVDYLTTLREVVLVRRLIGRQKAPSLGSCTEDSS